MRRWLLLISMVSGLVWGAETPLSFSWRAPLAVAASAPYQRITLPLEAYAQAAQPDLRDVRVFNADDVPVPLARIQQSGSSQASTLIQTLHWFPLTATKKTGTHDEDDAALNVRVRQGRNGTLVDIRTGAQRKRATKNMVRGYVLDASHLEKPGNVKALTLDWKEGTGFHLLDISASDNLQDWHSVRQGVQLARLEYDGKTIERRRIELSGFSGRYLRLIWRDPVAAPELSAVEIEETTAYWQSPPLLWSEPIESSQSSLRLQEGEFHYRLPQTLPVRRIRLLLPQGNVLLPLELWEPYRERQAWRTLARDVAYRVSSGGREWLHNEIALSGTLQRAFILRIDPRSSRTEAPKLQVAIEPEQIVFLAEGKPPYLLALGNADVKSVALPLATLVPGLGSDSAPEIADAKVLPVKSQAVSASKPALLQPLVEEIDWKKAALWSVLVAGVLAMGFMAWQLLRQMKDSQKK